MLLDPALLLTGDPDLLRNGFGVWHEHGVAAKWSFAAVTARDVAAPLAITLPTAMIVNLIAAVAADFVREHPSAATVVGVVAGLGGIAAVRSPRWEPEWKPALSALIGGALTTAGRIVEPYSTAASQLEEYRAAHPSPGTPTACIARTLALAPSSGLLLSELKAIHPGAAASVKSVLHDYPAFTNTTRWRWTLGTVAGPV